MDNLISKLGENPTTDPMITGAYEAYNLYNGTIKANEAKEFTLREWIDYDVTKETGMNKTITNKINVVARPDLNVEELPEIKTNYSNYEINASLKGIDVETIEKDNNVVVVENNSQSPFVYNDETKEFSLKKQGNYISSQIIMSPENTGDGEFCYKLTENGAEGSGFDIYIEDEKIGEDSLTSGEKSGCIALTNVQPTEKIKISYSTGYSSEIEFTFSVKFNKIKTTNKIPFKYCISDKNICEPNIDGNIINYKLDLNLDLGSKIVCTKINNNKTSCSDVMKIEPIKLEPLMAKNFIKNNEDERSFESIKVLDKIDIPDDAIKSWDASQKDNGSVMAYYLDEDNNGMYELYLAGDGGVIAPKDCSSLFYVPFSYSEYDWVGFVNVVKMDLSKLDTSKVTDMGAMFAVSTNGSNSLISLDISNFDTSNVTNMSNMFNNNNSLTSLDLSSFDTSKVTNMMGMFEDMYKLTNLNLSNFDTSNVTNMSNMFAGMKKIVSLDLSNFNTSNVTDMSSMFGGVSAGMTSLTSLNVSSFDTSKVTRMNSMFYGDDSLTSLDLSNFDTSNVTDMHDMFYNMRNLISLDLSKADFSKVTTYNSMFESSSKINAIKVKDESAKTFIEARLTDVNKTGVTITPAS